MAGLALKISAQELEQRINEINTKISALDNVIGQYGNLKNQMYRFIKEGDSNYQTMQDRIETNVRNCRKAKSALMQINEKLKQTAQELEQYGSETKNTIGSDNDQAQITVDRVFITDEI